MDLILSRKIYGESGIFGEISTPGGVFLFHSLEHAYGTNGDFAPKIPSGEYTCKRGEHQLKHGGPFETFMVMNVPDCTGILVHQGNYNENSEGCILIGKAIGLKLGANEKMLTYSKQAFEEFMTMEKECDEFKLTVE